MIDYKLPSTEELVKSLQELEHSYVEAFADEIEAEALDVLWKQMKMIKNEIEKRRLQPKHMA